MSLSHYDPLASLRAVESAFSRLLTEPQSNRPWTLLWIFTRPRMNSWSRPTCPR